MSENQSVNEEDRSAVEQVEKHTPGAYPSPPNGDGDNYSDYGQEPEGFAKAMRRRRQDYMVTKTTRIKVGTWNVASLPDTEKDLKGWFIDGQGVEARLADLSIDTAHAKSDRPQFEESIKDQEERYSNTTTTIPRGDPGLLPGGRQIGIYALGLQEIVDISSATEALKPFSDSHPARKWKQAMAEALPPGYHRVAEQQLLGLLILIYAAPELVTGISNVSTHSVGTGLMGYMGNKGAVGARLLLCETTRLLFINSHLSAGNEKASVERRNWDYAQVVSRMKFPAIITDELQADSPPAEGIGDEDFGFWFGDLNYRLEDLPGQDVRHLLTLHTKGQYGQSSVAKPRIAAELSQANHSLSPQPRNEIEHASSDLKHCKSDEAADDPASLKNTLDSLLTHDQLHAQIEQEKAFLDGWREGSIEFLPTYKYDVGSVGVFDSSEKKRGPSWCDRVLFRSRADRLQSQRHLKERADARKRDAQIESNGIIKAVEEESILFDYDPDLDGTDDEEVATKAAEKIEMQCSAEHETNEITLEHYNSHQRVLSSDHKPLEAIFSITYEASDPDLKAEVQRQVARDLDKNENERRPNITVIFERSGKQLGTGTDGASQQDQEAIDFGDLTYRERRTATLTAANTGPVEASLGFADRMSTSDTKASAMPSWINFSVDRASDNQNTNPSALHEYTILPGEAMTIELTAEISDLTLVQNLNKSREKHPTLSDVLVLRLRDGRDHFIPVSVHWLPSCFGRSINELICMPEGSIRQHGSVIDSNRAVKWSAPREIFRLTQAITSDVVSSISRAAPVDNVEDGNAGDSQWSQAAMPAAPGWPFLHHTTPSDVMDILAGAVRSSLDESTPFAWSEETTFCKIEVLSAVLYDFIRSLVDGVIPASSWQQIDIELVKREKSKISLLLNQSEALSILQESLSNQSAHRISLSFIVDVLIKLINTKKMNSSMSIRDDMSQIANIIAPVLIRIAPGEGSQKQIAKQKQAAERRACQFILALLNDEVKQGFACG